MGKQRSPAENVSRIDRDQLRCMQRLADVLAYSPDLVDLLGPNLQARVRVSDTGRGLVFEFEPQDVSPA